MQKSYEVLAHELKSRGIHPSIQRVMILGYLSEPDRHSTADEIYEHLLNDLPSLSKTTVYNTLHALLRAGLVRMVQFDGDEKRFDAIHEDHAHFRCERCGSIFHFDADISCIPFTGLEGFQVEAKDLFFKGLCPRCGQITHKKRRSGS